MKTPKEIAIGSSLFAVFLIAVVAGPRTVGIPNLVIGVIGLLLFAGFAFFAFVAARIFQHRAFPYPGALITVVGESDPRSAARFYLPLFAALSLTFLAGFALAVRRVVS